MKTPAFILVLTLCAICLASLPALADPLGTAFTYQGSVSLQGQPLNGLADFEFGLWDSATGGLQIGTTLAINGVTVTTGVFAALLDFGAAAWTGDARWLEISIRYPSGGGTYTILTPRVNVTATPYALQTKGIYVDNSGNVNIGPVTGQGPGAQRGPQAGARTNAVGSQPMNRPGPAKTTITTDPNTPTALVAQSTNPSGLTFGVFGTADSPTGEGIHGEGSTGVHGIATTDGDGVLGEGKNGVHGASTDTAGVGLKGEATATSGHAIGVHGTSAANSGEGVKGEGATGVHGISTNGEGMRGEGQTGVHGLSANGEGMRGEGQTGVHGLSTNGEGMRGEGQTGVHGLSTNGEGMRGEGATGVHGISTNGEGMRGEGATGVHGISTNGEGMRGEGATGVHGVSSLSGGKGLFGETTTASGTAVYGVASDSSATGIGIYGRSGAPNGFAGYFQGREYVSGSLGVGTTNPKAKLHIAGAPGVDGIMFPDGTLQTTASQGGALWLINGNNLYYNNGSVGIGTNTPAAGVDAEKTTGTAIQGATAGAAGTAVYGSATGTGATIGVSGASASTSGQGVLGAVSASTGSTIGVHGTSASAVGEGVKGEGWNGVHGVSSLAGGKGIFGEATTPSGTAIYGIASDSSANGIGVYARSGAPSGFAGYFQGREYVSGSLGVGTTNPKAKLHIAGTPGVDGIMFPDGSLQTTASSGGGSLWQVNGSNLYYNGGNVGIGTNNPAAGVDVEKTAGNAIQGATTGPTGVAVEGDANSPNGPAIGVHGKTSSQGGGGGAAIGGVGVEGDATWNNPPNGAPSIGVLGTNAGQFGAAVEGFANNMAVPQPPPSPAIEVGVYGATTAYNGEGVTGMATSATGPAIGVHGTSSSNTGEGVRGDGLNGVHGASSLSGGKGIFGEMAASSGAAVYGAVTDTFPAGTAGVGVYGRSGAPSGFAGYFQGRAYVSGSIGVGTTNPQAKLHIAGKPGVDGIMFPDGTLQTTASQPTSATGTITVGSVGWTQLSDCNQIAVGFGANLTINNPLIASTSLVFLTATMPEINTNPQAVSAYCIGVSAGQAQIAVSVMGWAYPANGCVPPTAGSLSIHYMIVNP